MPEPNGAFVHRFQEIQSEKAKAADFVLFLDEWYMGGVLLGPAGSRHLDTLVETVARDGGADRDPTVA